MLSKTTSILDNNQTKRILVVDDMKAELELISRYLTQAGYSVATAKDGKEAMQKVIEYKPDAIVTDWMMPEMGGLDLCRQLKKKKETADIPIVACTAKSRDVDRMWATKQGVKRYVVKPFTAEELIIAIKEAMA
ncbi:PleD family two-component system response regulator [Gloeocapsa sp. PCC 73106]|uniref:response regulator n=1 Tax=Gloeocapsa sp. PCC 73106 TaxID=102232 RepID=UPI0002ACD9A5|nr:response regulator [Gloeocapsa sp. PCC 73106]ELR97568.1 response regulator with CheY-like receiver domain and winged-helix DNA-binding domain [Gloeocapsa sp. PCC 73106]